MTEEIAVANETGGPPRRFRAVLPRQLYKKLLKEAVEQEVPPNDVLVRIVDRYFAKGGPDP